MTRGMLIGRGPISEPEFPFGILLRGYREQKGMSQSDLANAIGVNHSYISRLEKGGRWPSRLMVMKLCEFFGLSEGQRAEFFVAAVSDDDDLPNPGAWEPELIALFNVFARPMTDMQRQRLLGGIDLLVKFHHSGI